MGRIKSIPVKALGRQLLQQYPGKFSADFAKNKAVLAKVKPIRVKRVRNVLAGYLANEMRKTAEGKQNIRRMARPEREERRGRFGMRDNRGRGPRRERPF